MEFPPVLQPHQTHRHSHPEIYSATDLWNRESVGEGVKTVGFKGQV